MKILLTPMRLDKIKQEADSFSAFANFLDVKDQNELKLAMKYWDKGVKNYLDHRYCMSGHKYRRIPEAVYLLLRDTEIDAKNLKKLRKRFENNLKAEINLS